MQKSKITFKQLCALADRKRKHMNLTLKQTADLLNQFKAVTGRGFVYVTGTKRGVLELKDTWMGESLRVASAELEGSTVTLNCTKGEVRFGGTIPAALECITAELTQPARDPSPEQLKAALAGKPVWGGVPGGRMAVVRVRKKEKLLGEFVTDLDACPDNDDMLVEIALSSWKRANKVRAATCDHRVVEKF